MAVVAIARAVAGRTIVPDDADNSGDLMRPVAQVPARFQVRGATGLGCRRTGLVFVGFGV